LFVFWVALVATGISAQQVKILPPSFAYQQVAKQQLQSAQKLAIPFDVQALKAEDERKEAAGFPERIAKTIPVQLTPDNSGEWTTLPNGQRIWRLEIDAADANAVSLLYDQFIIPQGGKLYIYDLDYKVVNVYTDQDNPKRQEFSTDFIPGDKLILEYVASASVEEMTSFNNDGSQNGNSILRSEAAASGLHLVISGVSYAYKDVIACINAKFKELFENGNIEPRTPQYNNGSDACEVNANCTEGDNWYHQKHGVAATSQVLSDGTYICSGTAINNVLNDRTPYLLMAYHCGGDATPAQMNQWRFYFHWERTGCDNSSPLETYQYITGATSKVAIPLNGGSDGLLLQLNQPIPREWDVYFNGWDRRNTATAGGVGIHHPGGDVMKISTYTQTPTSTTANMSSGEVGAANAHWSLAYVKTANGWGVTEGGSSGSPLFNSDKRVIGTLTGGNSSCTATTGTNIYGKMSMHWDQAADPNKWMAKYLDPNNTGAQYIDGTYGEANLVTFVASKTNIYASEEITFTNHSYGDIDTYNWDFGSAAQPGTYTGFNPPSPILYNTAGNYTVTLTALKGTDVVGVFSVPITVTLKQNYCPVDPIAVGDPASTTTAPFPLGMSTGTSNRQTFSSAIYTTDELGMSNGGIITDLEWQANTAVSTARTLTIYIKEVTASAFSVGTTWATETSGLTAVYTSASTFTNPAGAVKIHLTTPFTYSGTKNLEVLVRANGGAAATTNSNCVYTATAGNTHQQWTSTTTTVPTTAGTPNANRPNIKFYCNAPCGVNPPVADFSISSASIFEGQSVTMTDKSTGPVVTYQWSFPGGIPSASTDPSPTVQYMNEGVYDITLTVKNTEGNDTKTVTGAVTVNARTPVPDFTSGFEGFIKAADYGPFFPLTGGTVDFDASSTLYYPQSFAWSFPGGDPNASDEVMPEVTYPGGIGNYDVILNATNNAGTGTKTATGYVQVGGTATVWNILQGEDPKGNPLFNNASIFTPGTGTYFAGGSGERFVAPAGGEVSAAKVYIATKTGSPSLLVSIYSDINGRPGISLGSVTVPSANITAGNYMTANFPNPIPVSGAYYVLVTRPTGTGSVRLGAVPLRTFAYNTAYVMYSNSWYSLEELINPSIYTSVNITTDFTFTTAELTSPFAYTKKNIDSAPETVSFTSSGHAWRATASHAWIHLSVASGMLNGGNGSLTFTVDDNTKQTLRKGTIDVIAGGIPLKVYVTQAGSYPIDVTAAHNSDNTGIEVNWTHDMQYASGDVFDSGEDYAAYQKNPKWYYQWSYIDGDAQPTYGLTINGIPIPGTGNPLSFITIDATQMGTGAPAHSGARYFACPASTNIPNDDWMISPELNFTSSFTFSFWARALQSTYPEAFKVTYSTGDKTEADFTNIVASVPSLTSTTWTKYTYTIPAEAKYVAINCVSNDAFMFMVDDIFIGTGVAPASTPVVESLLALKAETENTCSKVKPGASASMIANNEMNMTTDASGILPLPVNLKQGDMLKKTSMDKMNVAPFIMSSEKSKLRNIMKVAAVAAAEESLQWYSGNPAYIYGNPNGGHMEAAIRFEPGDIYPYDSDTIKAVEIYTYRPCNNVVINIRQNNQIIYSQPVGNITDNLIQQRIELAAPVVIDASKDLMIGYEYDQYAGDAQDVYVPIADAGPAIAGKGDLFSINGAPFTSTGVGNWIITAYVQPAIVDLTFNVYRDGTQIANGLTEKTYSDTEALPQGTQVCYTVTAVYGNPLLESTQSDKACLYTNFIVVDGNTEFCQGGSATLKAPADDSYTYQWYKDDSPVTDATADNYVATESGVYYVVITTGSEVLTSETVTITVYELPAPPVISIDNNHIIGGSSATLTVENPQTDFLYQWYKDMVALGDPSTETNLTVNESGVYYAVSVNGNGCKSDPSNEINLEATQFNALFTPSASSESFAAPGENQTLTLTINDPNGYIASMGLSFFVNAPDWITYTISGNVITFTAAANMTGLIRTGVIKVWLGTAGSTFSTDSGYEIPASQKSELTTDMLDYNFADAIYTGTENPANVALNSAYSSLGAITVLYNGSAIVPINVGTYSISINAAEGANFDAVTNFVLGNFTIFPATLTIRPDDVIRPYGAANPNFTVTFTGLTGSDSQADLDLSNLTVMTTATESSLPGTYPIVVSGAQNNNPNYVITYQEGTLTISRMDQIITYSVISSMEVGTTFNVNASASSGLAVTYVSSDPAVAEIDSNGKITAIAEGVVNISMSQAGNVLYNAAAEVTQQLVVTNLTGINHVASQTITVYPNPVAKSTPVYVNADVDEMLLTDAMINVYNASGSLVKNVKVTGKLTKVDLSVASGTYLFTLKGKEGVIKNMKVIVK